MEKGEGHNYKKKVMDNSANMREESDVSKKEGWFWQHTRQCWPVSTVLGKWKAGENGSETIGWCDEWMDNTEPNLNSVNYWQLSYPKKKRL